MSKSLYPPPPPLRGIWVNAETLSAGAAACGKKISSPHAPERDFGGKSVVSTCWQPGGHFSRESTAWCVFVLQLQNKLREGVGRWGGGG